MSILVPCLLGLSFGWSLQRAGLTHYARIVNVFRLRDLTVLRFMLTALLVGAIGIQVGVSLGFAARAPLPPTAALANLVGGVLFGVGMATAGYCPGTIVAEAGEGRLDAWLAGLSGLIVGALAFGLLQPSIMPVLARVGALGRVTLAELCGANPWLVLLVFCQLVLLVLRVTARVGLSREPPAHV
jgi:uncharacterized membrane protein YedE/YeeE